jgi:3-oxoacyl-[acyl-carrier-protein] synthase-3
MDGPSIMSFTLEQIPKSIIQTIKNNGLEGIHNIKYFLLHQASMFVLQAIKKVLKLNLQQSFIINLENKGNTVSSSIPIALKENYNQFEKGDNIIISGFGVGLSWSTCIILKA